MNGVRTSSIKPRGKKVNPSEWENILGRLDVVTDEINRRLGLSTRIEERLSGVSIVPPPKK